MEENDEPAAPRETADLRPVDEAFFIVGIGASAGGLEALNLFLSHVAFDGAAFVVVQHLAPNQRSMLADILGRASKLRVITIEDGLKVEPNCVYIAPPNSEISIKDCVLHVRVPMAVSHGQLPIDAFLRSLANDHGAQSMGVVLSGTGTDGTFGLAAIKAAGGITFVQDPATAKFDGMPRSALESGAADFCLSPDAIAEEIRHLAEHSYLRRQVARPDLQEQVSVLAPLIKTAFGIDLSHYKPNTIERRLQRRMAVHRIERIDDYVRLCRTDAKELAALHHDLLINVTAFFRDGEPFEVLKAQVLPRVLDRKRNGDPVRLWVPGCASGEEAYSLAIVLLELLEERERSMKLQIFGTDVDVDAIQQARRAIYSPNIAADVSPERLRRFFVQTDDGRYLVGRQVRDLVVFANQNLSRDAPFSRIDVVSCRNVLIYLQPGIQRKVLRIFHYALVPEGFMMLGTSETVGDSSELFSLVDRKNKIYQAKHVALTTAPIDVTIGVAKAPPPDTAPFGATRPMISIAQLADRKILDQYAPAGVVINENLEILYYRGRTAAYLEQPSGVATHGILKLVRPELYAPLRAAIDRTLTAGSSTVTEAQLKDEHGVFRPTTLVIQPLQEPETRARCLLVLFREPPAKPEPETPPPTGEGAPEEARVQQLTQELSLTKDYLHSAIDELERSNEDLKAANEELQSSNEELQSTNEELETSKEELQSTNEELITLNEELQNRMRDLSLSNDDLHNLLGSLDTPVLIVGIDLRIRRFTRSAEKLLHLIPSDAGRSIGQLNSFLSDFRSEEVVGQVISSVTAYEKQVRGADQRWYRVTIVPYKTLDLAIRGAIVSLTDIDLEKRRSDLAHAVDDYVTEFLSAIPHPLVILNRELSVLWTNEVYLESFGLLREELIGSRLADINDGQLANPRLQKALRATAASGTPFKRLEMEVDTPFGGPVRVRLSGSRIRGVANDTVLLLLSIEGDLPSPEAAPPVPEGP